MSEEESAVQNVLDRLDREATAVVNQNKELVRQFVESLCRHLQQEDGILRGAHIRHSGSAYENLAVSLEADFDLILQLGDPFVSSNFKVTMVKSKIGYYKLKKPKMKVIAKPFSSGRKNLKALRLRLAIFERLQTILGTIQLPGMEVQCFPKLAALQVNLIANNRQGKIEMDLTPQIVGRMWSENPNLVSKSALPPCLQEYIQNNENNGSPILFYTPAVPKAENLMEKEIACMMGFSMLEKHFLRKEGGIHHMVRLAKLVKESRDWTSKYQLKSFHLKRLAIKEAEMLRNKTIWKGFKVLMNCLEKELVNGGVKDCFVQHQVIYQLSSGKLRRFQLELHMVQNWGMKELKVLCGTL